MAFNEQLTKLRKRKNITQIEMAEKLGVKQYVISSWETGRSEPCIRQIIMLSDILDVPIDYLLDKEVIRTASEEDFNKTIENFKQDVKDDFANTVNELCKKLPDVKKEKILAIIKELTDF